MTNDPLPLVGDGELPVQPGMVLAGELRYCYGYDVHWRKEFIDSHPAGDEIWSVKLYAAPVGQPAPDLAGVLEALENIADDYADRFDLDSPSTNPGIKSVVKQARAAITSLRARMGMPT